MKNTLEVGQSANVYESRRFNKFWSVGFKWDVVEEDIGVDLYTPKVAGGLWHHNISTYESARKVGKLTITKLK